MIQVKNNSELAALEKRLAWTEEWYAVRFQHLRKLCEDHNLLTEFCNIAANGREDMTSPPTFQNLLNLANLEKEKAIKAAKQTAKNMEEMERDLYLKLNEKEKTIEDLKDLLVELSEKIKRFL
jgi:RNA processing factor Prp31